MEPAVNIDDNRNSNGCLCGGYADGEQREEEALKLSGIKQSVEHSKIDVYRVEDKLDGDEHGNQVAPGDESENADEEEQGAQNQEKLYWYHITCPFLK